MRFFRGCLTMPGAFKNAGSMYVITGEPGFPYPMRSFRRSHTASRLWSRCMTCAGCSSWVVRVTSVEIIAAITRRERGRTRAPTDACTARQAFRGNLATAYQVIEVPPVLANRAMRFAEQHGLRGYEAMQLAAGCEVHVRYLAAGLPAITCIAADTERNTAAIAE